MDATQKPVEDERLEEIKVVAQKIYPGRTWGELSEGEQEAVFNAYEGQRDMGYGLVQGGQDMMANAGKTVGPLNVYMNNPWESLAGGLMAGAGYGMQGKANKMEREGRKATADLATNRDARDREAQRTRAEEEERRRQEWLTQILGARA